jgi:hypothetical protein
MLLVIDHCAFEGIVGLASAAILAWNAYQQRQLNGLKKDSRQSQAPEDKADLLQTDAFPRR